MIYKQTRKTRTGNFITYRKIIDIASEDSHGLMKISLDCGHITHFSNCGRDRIKSFMFYNDPENALLGCKECGKLNHDALK